MQWWADVLNPSDAHVMAALIRHMPDLPCVVTVRDRAETIALATSYGLTFRVVGRDRPGPIAKVLSYGGRVLQLQRAVPDFAASVSFNDMNAILVARIRRRPSITLMDNDLDFDATKWSYAKRAEVKVNLRADHIIVPNVFPIDDMVRLGARRSSIHTFDGYKEDLYVADFEPDPSFPGRIPFSEYVVVRPEARSAFYVREADSLVPGLIERLGHSGQNVVYLPRDAGDEDLVPRGMTHVHVPRDPPNGLQLAWHARAVLTGSGSFAREAACLGVPAVSFFPERLLLVDRRMVQERRVFHSRNIDDIVKHVLTTKTEPAINRDRSRSVLRTVVAEVERCINPDSQRG